MDATNLPQSTTPRNTIPVVPAAKKVSSRAVKNAIHFLSAAANCLRYQTNDAQLHRIADQLFAVAEELKVAAR
jgi:hypothetical protein